jgi:hypothetical protein
MPNSRVLGVVTEQTRMQLLTLLLLVKQLARLQVTDRVIATQWCKTGIPKVTQKRAT